MRIILGYFTFLLADLLVMAPSHAAGPAIAAAENQLNVSGGFEHTQYHENLAIGDDESGYIPGLGLGLSLLRPLALSGAGVDVYTSVNYDFDHGNITYAGHARGTNAPVLGTDSASFNRVEVRIGIGLPLYGGLEAIPFLAGGYQSWNRRVSAPGSYGLAENYHSGLFGLGLKFDIPVDPTLVASASGEALGMAGGGFSSSEFSGGFGATGQERVELGLDDRLGNRFHIFTHAFWEHFNYAGTRPVPFGINGQIYEPFSTTTQFGLNAGIGYNFN